MSAETLHFIAVTITWGAVFALWWHTTETPPPGWESGVSSEDVAISRDSQN